MLAVFVEKLGWEGSRTNTRRVGLDDADDFVECPRSKPGSRSGVAGSRVGGRDIRIRSEVDIQHCALRTFEHDVGAFLAQRVQRKGDISDQRRNLFRQRELLVEGLLEVHGRQAEVVLQHEVVEVQYLAETRRETISLKKIGHAHRAPCDLVLVSRTYSAPGRA